LNLWIDFVKDIAYPVNAKIRDILAANTHLYDGEYPDCFIEIFDLVAERELMLKAWDQKNFTNLIGRVTFPREADEVVNQQLKEKQQRKAELLNLVLRPLAKKSRLSSSLSFYSAASITQSQTLGEDLEEPLLEDEYFDPFSSHETAAQHLDLQRGPLTGASNLLG